MNSAPPKAPPPIPKSVATSATKPAASFSARTLAKDIEQLQSIKALEVADPLGGEFEFGEKDFIRVRDMIAKVAGISLAPSKRSMVYSRLVRRLRAKNYAKFSEYLDALECSSSNPEWEHFTNALTTNLTSFYREAHHFQELKKQLQQIDKPGNIELWCSAASTGEEPYTMAITAMEAFNSLNPPVRILATDIDTQVLAEARRGIYRPDQVDKVPPDLLRKYFQPATGEHQGLYQVRREVQAIVQFRQLNLTAPNWNIRPGFDALFCRNVMIYFDKDIQLQILKRFAPLMNPKALLYAGHSENFAMARDYFTLQGKTIYEVRPEKACKPSVLTSSKKGQP